VVGPKNGTKNDVRQKKACQIGKEKNDKASRCCWSAYQKKRLGVMGLNEMRLGDMTLGAMLPNSTYSDIHKILKKTVIESGSQNSGSEVKHHSII